MIRATKRPFDARDVTFFLNGFEPAVWCSRETVEAKVFGRGHKSNHFCFDHLGASVVGGPAEESDRSTVISSVNY